MDTPVDGSTGPLRKPAAPVNSRANQTAVEIQTRSHDEPALAPNAEPPPGMNWTLQLTPKGQLQVGVEADAPALPEALAARLAAAFAAGTGHGLLHLGAAEVTTALHSQCKRALPCGGPFQFRVIDAVPMTIERQMRQSRLPIRPSSDWNILMKSR